MMTKFASAERLSNVEVVQQHAKLISWKYFSDLFNAVNGIACVINQHRQIIHANQRMLDLLDVKKVEDIMGIRPGEAITCKYAFQEEGGCGTSEHCAVCGVIDGILECQKSGQSRQKEARLTTNEDNEEKSWDMKVYVNPLVIENERFMVLTLEDISDQKRKSNLEQVFFHDINNAAGGLNGLMSLVKSMPDKNQGSEMIDISVNLSHELMAEINHYWQFTLAENGELNVNISQFGVFRFLQDIVSKITYHKVSKDKNIELLRPDNLSSIETDKVLLGRVLTNMLKNALEASIPNSTVTLGAKSLENGTVARFYVNNQMEMQEEVKLQVFQRSFSTKGKNRGIGTYSIKLFTEKYMNGQAGFISNPSLGTTFYVDLPLKWPV